MTVQYHLRITVLKQHNSIGYNAGSIIFTPPPSEVEYASYISDTSFTKAFSTL